MIRSCHIPAVLNRICDARVPTVLLVTTDGELLGTSNLYPAVVDPDACGTLLADITAEYKQLGDVAAPRGTASHLDCLLIVLDEGLAAAAACERIDCFLLAIAKPDTPPGLLRARLRSLADHVQESMSLLMESSH